MRNKESNFWNDGIKLVSFCPLCESRSSKTQARLLGQEGETRLLHVKCKKCSNSMLALVFASSDGMSSVGLVTDLSYDDAIRFKEGDPVYIDDIISLHEEMGNKSFLSGLTE